MTREDLEKLVPDRQIVENTIKAMREIRLFLSFDSTVKLGVTIDANSIPFERLMVFGWIKDLIDERKN